MEAKKSMTAIEMAKALFEIHSHAEIEAEINPEQVVYAELDVVNLLMALGFPEPDWLGYAKQYRDFPMDINKEQ